MKKRFLTLSFTLFTLLGCASEETNDIYLIPEGYEGYIYAFYNVKGAPEVEKEGDYEVHNINNQGYFVTSTPDMDYGTVTDKYYYVDEDGNRTKINKECVRVGGISGFEDDTDPTNKINIVSTYAEVIKKGCSQSFMSSGEGIHKDNSDAILGEVIEKYYKSKLRKLNQTSEM
ncbi:DUF6843 domain-containing protein [Priestia endophytica]|uniref:DUF6843 domain-containing protein n=1 Tax=Priestia endophytica TaxID=135735 RepID=UPI000F52D0DC|nr:hypothetical protein [Priestia endophytica]RPK03114.1 hypothetical protein FH5_02190 [Priestia endophytica]